MRPRLPELRQGEASFTKVFEMGGVVKDAVQPLLSKSADLNSRMVHLIFRLSQGPSINTVNNAPRQIN